MKRPREPFRPRARQPAATVAKQANGTAIKRLPRPTEEEDENGEPRSKRSKHMRTCHICEKGFNATAKKHVLQRHLPWYLSVWCCFKCRKMEQGQASYHKIHAGCRGGSFTNDHLAEWLALNAGFLYKLCELILGGPRDLFILLNYVTVKKLFHGDQDYEVTPHQSLLWSLLNVFLSEVNLEDSPFKVNPPNAPAALLHHTVIIALLLQLTPAQRDLMRNRSEWIGKDDQT